MVSTFNFFFFLPSEKVPCAAFAYFEVVGYTCVVFLLVTV